MKLDPKPMVHIFLISGYNCCKYNPNLGSFIQSILVVLIHNREVFF